MAVAVTVFTLLVCVLSTQSTFVSYDDLLYVTAQPIAGGFSSEAAAFALTSVVDLYWHPFAWISHAFDIELFGMNPIGHHFTSVLLHSLTAGLLFLVLFRIGTGTFAAAGGSLLWALHPLRVESFAWVAERKDVLCALFVVAAIWGYLRYVDQPSRRRYALWLCFGALSLMSKPTAVTLPVILLLLDYWPARRAASVVRLIGEKLPLVAMSAVVVYLTILGQVQSGSTSYYADVPLALRLANAVVSYVRYFGKMLWPVDLACFYPYRREWPIVWVATSVVLLAAITALVVAQRKRRPWLMVGWFWFVVAVLPNAGLIQAGRQAMADRFTHLGMIGLVIAAVWTAKGWAGTNQKRRKLLAYVAAGAIAFLSALTIRQIGFWHDSETLFRHAIAVEDSGYMRGNLAETLMKEQRLAEAEKELRIAKRLSPDRFEYPNNLAALLLTQGRVDEAAVEATIATRLGPDRLPAVQTAGFVMLRKQDWASATENLDRAIRLGADPIPLSIKLNDAAASLASRGRLSEAEPLVRKAITYNPTLVQARRNLVLVLLDSQRMAEAREALIEARRVTGDRQEYRDLAREAGLADAQ